MAPRVKATSEPQVIQLADGAKFPTYYNNEKKSYEVSCDLCREIINVGPAGTTSYRLESHRTACQKKIAKQHEIEIMKSRSFENKLRSRLEIRQHSL
jgi:hypothetical protein